MGWAGTRGRAGRFPRASRSRKTTPVFYGTRQEQIERLVAFFRKIEKARSDGGTDIAKRLTHFDCLDPGFGRAIDKKGPEGHPASVGAKRALLLLPFRPDLALILKLRNCADV
jgi:hypothetical protein